MSSASNAGFVPQQNKILGDREFDKLSEFIGSHCGIKLPRAKKNNVAGKVAKPTQSIKHEFIC